MYFSTGSKGFYDHPYHAALETEEFLRQVHDALSALTPKQRTVFILRYKHQLPLKDIADRLERSVDTVKAYLYFMPIAGYATNSFPISSPRSEPSRTTQKKPASH